MSTRIKIITPQILQKSNNSEFQFKNPYRQTNNSVQIHQILRFRQRIQELPTVASVFNVDVLIHIHLQVIYVNRGKFWVQDKGV